jgi:hypothetical protein
MAERHAAILRHAVNAELGCLLIRLYDDSKPNMELAGVEQARHVAIWEYFMPALRISVGFVSAKTLTAIEQQMSEECMPGWMASLV